MRKVVEYALAWDNPIDDEDPIAFIWDEKWHGKPCPVTSKCNNHPVHRVKRTVTYSPWEDAS